MRTIVALFLTVFFVGCSSESTGRHVNAITGEPCDLDDGTYEPRDPGAPEPRVDCSHHDDVEPGSGACCEFPQPGCDATGCCDEDVVVFPDDGGGDEVDEHEGEGPVVL